jgi:ribosomal-protein-alanine N-acetyltransferase
MSDVQIRPWQKEDARALASVANNRNIWLNVRDRFPYPYTLNDAEQWIQFTSGQKPVQNFAIIYKSEVAGSIGVLLKDDIYRKSIEIGYFLGEQYWGKGIDTRAVELLLKYIGEQFDVVRVYAEVFEHNKASMRVLEKSGFYLESIRKMAVVKNDVLMNDYVWVKLVQ